MARDQLLSLATYYRFGTAHTGDDGATGLSHLLEGMNITNGKLCGFHMITDIHIPSLHL